MKYIKYAFIVLILLGIFFILLYMLYQQHNKPSNKIDNIMNKIHDNKQGVTSNEYGNKPESLENTNNFKNVVADKTIVLFTETEITLDMTMEELKEKLPPHCLDLLKFENDMLKSVNIIAGYPIQSHEFWNGFNICIKEDRIRYLRYYAVDWDSDFSEVGVYNLDDAVKKIESLFEHLKNQLGSIYNRRIIRSGSIHEIMYAWERKNDWVAFIPNSIPDEKMSHLYQVFIFPTKEEMEQQFSTATHRVPPNFKIWLDDI